MENKIKRNLIKVYLCWQGDRIKRKFNGNLQESLSLRSLRIENTKNGSKRKEIKKKVHLFAVSWQCDMIKRKLNENKKESLSFCSLLAGR